MRGSFIYKCACSCAGPTSSSQARCQLWPLNSACRTGPARLRSQPPSPAAPSAPSASSGACNGRTRVAALDCQAGGRRPLECCPKHGPSQPALRLLCRSPSTPRPPPADALPMHGNRGQGGHEDAQGSLRVDHHAPHRLAGCAADGGEQRQQSPWQRPGLGDRRPARQRCALCLSASPATPTRTFGGAHHRRSRKVAGLLVLLARVAAAYGRSRQLAAGACKHAGRGGAGGTERPAQRGGRHAAGRAQPEALTDRAVAGHISLDIACTVGRMSGLVAAAHCAPQDCASGKPSAHPAATFQGRAWTRGCWLGCGSALPSTPLAARSRHAGGMGKRAAGGGASPVHGLQRHR